MSYPRPDPDNWGQDNGAWADQRRRPCKKRTWCIGFDGHPSPSCIEVPRAPHEPADFGPNRSKR